MMMATTEFFSESTLSMATAAILELWLRARPSLSLPPSAVLVAEVLTLTAALLWTQLTWQTLPQLLFIGFVTAACALRLVTSAAQSSDPGSDDTDGKVIDAPVPSRP